MKTLAAEFTTELEKEVNCLKHLVLINFSTPLRLTDADVNVWNGVYWWYPWGLEFDAAKISSTAKVDSINFSVSNVDRTFSTIILTEQTQGKECHIWRVALDKNMKIVGWTMIFMGYLDAVSADNQRARFEVYNHFVKWRVMTPRRVHQATCHWTFKGARCAYSGAGDWCDHSWSRCVALSNSINFGGFRWLPSLQNTRLVWGR
jgi:hypothetical protein